MLNKSNEIFIFISRQYLFAKLAKLYMIDMSVQKILRYFTTYHIKLL